MCGIAAVLLADSTGDVNTMLFDALTVLQHRGQDAAGMVTCELEPPHRLHLRKDNGLVKDVFTQQHMLELVGPMGLAHARYPTAGSSSCAEAQPLYTNYPCGVCIAHNGNLTNTAELAAELTRNMRHVNTDSDSEMLVNVFADVLADEVKRRRGEAAARGELDAETADFSADDVFAAVRGVMAKCRGGYSVVMLVNKLGLVAFRDPHGIRPVVYGRRAHVAESARKPPSGAAATQAAEDPLYDHAFMSESVAFDALGFELVRDIAPGEAMVVCHGVGGAPSVVHARQCSDASAACLRPCIFEYVYFARPDSVMDGVAVYQSRLEMGERLARRIQQLRPAHDIDVVIPIPDTARTCALQAAYTLGVPYREGFIKNRYIARTFIMPGQQQRRKSVRLKLNTIRAEFRGKAVLLVDDSIVRGTTSKELVLMAREAGARAVYFVSCSPEVRYPNVYGIDIPTHRELVAHNRTPEEVAAHIGADWVVYQSISDLEDSVRKLNPALEAFDTSCFSGTYVTGDIDAAYLARLMRTTMDDKPDKPAPTTGAPPKRPRITADGPRAAECSPLHNDTQKNGTPPQAHFPV